MTDQQRELELLRQENAQLKQALEQEKVRSMNFAREAFLVDLLGKHQLTGKEYRQSLRELELNFPTPWFAAKGGDQSGEPSLCTLSGAKRAGGADRREAHLPCGNGAGAINCAGESLGGNGGGHGHGGTGCPACGIPV